MNYFSTLFLIQRKNPKFIIFFLTIILLSVISIATTLVTNEEFLFSEIRSDRMGVKITLGNFSREGIVVSDGSVIVKNLEEQSELLARMEQSLVFENHGLFNETAVQLTEVRGDFLKMPEAQKYAANFPTKNQNELKKVFYQYFQTNRKTPYARNDHVILAVLNFLNIFAICWLPLNAILNSNILLTQRMHRRTVQGFPLSELRQVLTNISFYGVASFVGLLIPVVVTSAAGLFVSMGRLDYPVPVYLTSYQTVPF